MEDSATIKPEKVICGDMVKRSKPAPDIYLKACEELQVEPERAYAIEDSYNGIRAAHSGWSASYNGTGFGGGTQGIVNDGLLPE